MIPATPDERLRAETRRDYSLCDVCGGEGWLWAGTAEDHNPELCRACWVEP